MLVKHLVVEASVSNGEASELSGVSVWILATGYGSFNKSVLEKFFVEVACMAAKIADQIANFGPDSSIFVADKSVQVHIDICVVDRFVKLF